MNEHCVRRFKVQKQLTPALNLSMKESTYSRILQYLANTCDERTFFRDLIDNSPLELDRPSHNHAVERNVKAVTEAFGNW